MLGANVAKMAYSKGKVNDMWIDREECGQGGKGVIHIGCG